jgi:penicillin-binding protein 1B
LFESEAPEDVAAEPTAAPMTESSEEFRESRVELFFDSAQPDAPVKKIELNAREVPEVRLEPELIATLVPPPAKGTEESDAEDTGDGHVAPATGERKEIRTYVSFHEIPHAIKLAVMAAEDQHYLDHRGLDPRGIARALFVNLKTLSLAQGGSTITQQLVKNLMARRNKNIFRKISELFLSLMLEARYDKELILERYLNEVYLGQAGSLEVHGVVEGAQLFFGKTLEELHMGEIAMMAGFIRGPGFYSPYTHRDRAEERGKWVIKRMVEAGFVSRAEELDARTRPIRIDPPQKSSNRSPWFTEFVKAKLIEDLKDRWTEEEIFNRGLRVYTTIDPRLNRIAQQAVTEGVEAHEKALGINTEADRLEGVLVAADPATGYIKALVGGRDYSKSSFNRILNMKRQVGSTFKPFVFLTSLLQEKDPDGIPNGPAHPIEDAAWTYIYDRGRQRWTPKNFEKEYLGWISHRIALAKSINTATARLGVEVGIENVADTAKKLGIQSPLPVVPSLSLGVAELAPVELLEAYATLANHGSFDRLTAIRAITERDGTPISRWVPAPTERVPAPAADLLTDMLRSVLTIGSGREASKLGLKRPAAGKTGTTSNHRDAWFAGYTPKLATVTWVGFDLDDPARGIEVEVPGKGKKNPPRKKKIQVRLTGSTSALPIWVRFTEKALENSPPIPFVPSSDVLDGRFDVHSGAPATPDCPDSLVIEEKYLKLSDPDALLSEKCETDWPPSAPQSVEK